MLRWGLITLAAACYRPTIQPGAPCNVDNDCPGDQKCIGLVCGGSFDAPPPPTDSEALVDAPPDAPPDAAWQQIVIGDNANEVRDTEIWIDFPMQNMGTDNHVSVDLNESGLFWFDLTSVDADLTVVKATLTVKVSDSADEGGGTVTIHRLREAWVEGEATWVARATNQAWSVAGARPPTASDNATLATFSPAATETSYDIQLPPSLIEDWTNDPALNFGLLFVRGTSLQHVHIHSRESGAPAKLTITAY